MPRSFAARKSAEDFVADAFGHHKFIGWNAAAAPLFEAAGVEEDAGVIELKGTAASAKAFLKACAALRMWERDVQP